MVDAVKAYQQSIPQVQKESPRVDSNRPARPEADRAQPTSIRPDRAETARSTDKLGDTATRPDSDRERRDLLAALGSERSGTAGKSSAQARGSLLDVTV